MYRISIKMKQLETMETAWVLDRYLASLENKKMLAAKFYNVSKRVILEAAFALLFSSNEGLPIDFFKYWYIFVRDMTQYLSHNNRHKHALKAWNK